MYNLGEAVGYIRLEMGKFLQEAAQAQNATKRIENEFDKLGDVSKSIEGIIVKSFAAIGAAVVAGLGQAVNVGSQFEASMSQVAATMGMTADDIASGSADFEKLSDAAKKMGETTKYSASQAADALNFLALAGYNTEQAISTLPTVLNLASAGGMELARASDMITDAASALGLELDDMSLFADKMAKAAQSSNTSVEQLGNAILQIGGTARNMAGGITELNTALGILANNGIKSAEGGTALRQIMLNLTAPTEKAAKYIEELGLKVKDLNGDVRPLNDIFRDLDEILQSKGITGSADKIEALAQIFDARQLKSATALLNNYGESWDRLYEKIDNAEGAASTMAETMETNLKGALTILGSTAEGFGITVYDSIESSFKNAVSEATKQLSNLNDAFKSAEMQKSLKQISDAISEAIVKLSEFISVIIPKMVKGFSDLIDNFDKVSGVIAGFTTAVGLAQAGALLFQIQTDLVTQSLIAQKLATLAANAALLANPYTAVAVAVGVLVAALVKEHEQQKKNYELIDEVNKKYKESAEITKERAKAYDEEIDKIEDLNNSHDEEIGRVNELVNVIQKNVDETGKIINNTEMVKDAIDDLNAILPINIKYQGEQILNYEDLVVGSKNYCEQLKQQAIVEANISKYKAAAVAYDDAISKQEELTKNLEEAQARFEEVRKAHEDYDADISQFEAEADAMGMFVGDYINDLYDSSKAALENAQNALDENTKIIDAAQKDMQDAEKSMQNSNVNLIKSTNELYKQQVEAGQEITGLYKTESEARIKIAEIEAERIREINKNANSGVIEDRKENAEEVLTAEEELEKQLEELEIQYNTGVIKTEKEYHDKRLELLDNFHGEWSKKSSQWLKQETDYQQKIIDETVKESERQAQESARQKEQELRDAENAAKEKERLFKEETNAKIKEIDRRKELDENYTDERYIKDLQNLVSTLNTESDLYKDLMYKIQKYEKQVTENHKKELEQQKKDTFDMLQDHYDIYKNKGYSLEQYLDDLKAFLSTLDEASDLYIDVQKEITKTEEAIEKASSEAAEKEQKRIEDSNKQFLETLKNRVDADEKYTKEMYLKDLEAYAAILNKESDLYQDVEKEIVKTRKSIREENQKTADAAFKTWQTGFNALKSEAEKSYKEIQSKQKKLEETLNSQIKLYETKTKKVLNLTTGLWEDTEIKKTGTQYLKDQINELEAYQKSLERLEEKGISDELMQEILGMDEESAKEYVAQLNSMSAESLKTYDKAYNELKAKNKEFSEKYYADEVDAFKNEWGKKIEEYIDTLPEAAREAAQETIQAFIAGLSDTDYDTSNDEFYNLFSDVFDSISEKADKGELFKNYGTKSINELVNELKDGSEEIEKECVNLGVEAGNSFADGMQDAEDTIKERTISWISTIKENIRNSLNEIGIDLNDLFSSKNYISSDMLNSNNINTGINKGNVQISQPTLTKDDIKNAIHESMPSGNVYLTVDGNTFAQISRHELNFLAQQNGTLGLQV